MPGFPGILFLYALFMGFLVEGESEDFFACLASVSCLLPEFLFFLFGSLYWVLGYRYFTFGFDRFDSIRFTSIHFTSIQFNLVRFCSVYGFPM